MDTKKLVEDITTGINYLGFNPKEFCVQMSKQHRALQATFTTLCFEWLKMCADMETKQRYDERNQYTIHKAAYLARLLPYFQYGENNPMIRTTHDSLEVEPFTDYIPAEDITEMGWDVLLNHKDLVTVKLASNGEVSIAIKDEDGYVTNEFFTKEK